MPRSILISHIMNKQLITEVIMIIVFGTTTAAFLIAQSTPQLSYGTVAVQGPQRKVSLAMSGENIYRVGN
jgi:hypothetical protein